MGPPCECNNPNVVLLCPKTALILTGWWDDPMVEKLIMG